MLIQPSNVIPFDFPKKLVKPSSPVPSSQQSPLLHRKNIILQSPPDLAPRTKPIINTTPLLGSILQLAGSRNYLSIDHLVQARMSSETRTRESESDTSELSITSPQKINSAPVKTKIIKKMKTSTPANKDKKTYEISRFFVKNYVGALKATLHNPLCENDILTFMGCQKEHLAEIKHELDKLLRENPKHNRMQLYKLIVNPVLNPIFQYFLRRKVVSWVFTSSKMQDRQAHLLARKNFLHLCLKAKELTPYNFKIAMNFK